MITDLSLKSQIRSLILTLVFWVPSWCRCGSNSATVNRKKKICFQNKILNNICDISVLPSRCRQIGRHLTRQADDTSGRQASIQHLASRRQFSHTHVHTRRQIKSQAASHLGNSLLVSGQLILVNRKKSLLTLHPMKTLKANCTVKPDELNTGILTF